jgi:hypothetical protein
MKIQDIKLYLKGVGHTILEIDLVERLLGILPTGFDPTY